MTLLEKQLEGTHLKALQSDMVCTACRALTSALATAAVLAQPCPKLVRALVLGWALGSSFSQASCKPTACVPALQAGIRYPSMDQKLSWLNTAFCLLKLGQLNTAFQPAVVCVRTVWRQVHPRTATQAGIESGTTGFEEAGGSAGASSCFFFFCS